MECYVTYSIKGFYAFNENNELIGEKLFKEEEILQKLIEIDNKEIPTEESLSILKSEIMQTKNPKQSDEIPEKKSDFSSDSS